MSKKKYNYLYKITHLKSDRIYIGIHSTDNIDDGYFGCGIFHKNGEWKKLNRGKYYGTHHIRNAFVKYGKNAFKREIINYFDSREAALKEEKEIVNEEFINDKKTFNNRVGGLGGNFSKEVRKKISENNPMYRKSVKEKISKIQKELWNEERKNKLSENNPMNNEEVLTKMSGKNSVWFGRKHTKETINKLKKINSNKKWTMSQRDKTLKKMESIRKDGYKIYDKKTKKYFYSIKEIIIYLREKEEIKVGSDRLIKCIRGVRENDVLNKRFERKADLQKDKSKPHIFMRGKNYNVRIWNKKEKKYWKRSLNTTDEDSAKSKLDNYYKQFLKETKNSS